MVVGIAEGAAASHGQRQPHRRPGAGIRNRSVAPWSEYILYSLARSPAEKVA